MLPDRANIALELAAFFISLATLTNDVQTIAKSTNSRETDTFRTSAELASESFDVYVYGSFASLIINSPNLFNELASRQDLIRMTGHREQQLKLFKRQDEALSLYSDLVHGTIDHKIAELYLRIGSNTVALQQRSHAHDQLFGMKRFDQVIIGAKLKTPNNVRMILSGSNEENRRAGIFTQTLS